MWNLARRAGEKEVSQALDTALITLAACLVGARAEYVLLRLPYYSAHWTEALQIWLGGLSVGGAVCLLIVAAVSGESLRALSPQKAPLLAPMVITGWLGCLLAGCAYGAAVDEPIWWAMPALDESGVMAYRFPLQPLAALSLLVYTLWLERNPVWAWYPGKLGSLTMLGVGVNLFIFHAIQVEPVFRWNGLSVDCWASLGLVLFSMAFFFYARANHRQGEEPELNREG